MKKSVCAALSALFVLSASAFAEESQPREKKRSFVEELLTIPVAPVQGAQIALDKTIFNLGDVEVSSSRVESPKSLAAATELPHNVTVIGEKEIAESPSVDLPELLASKEGVTYTDDIGLGLGARIDLRGFGGEAKQALVLFDGIRAVEPFDNSVTWSLYPQEYLRQVEVRRGGGSAAYGEGALSGVVNLKTKGPTEAFHASTEHALGNFRTLRDFADVSGTAAGVGYYVGARYATTDGYRQNGGYESKSTLVKHSYEWSDVLKAENAFYYANDDTAIPGPLLPSEDAANRRQKDPDAQYGDKFRDDLLQDAFTTSLYLDSVGVELTNLAGFRHRDQDSVRSFGGVFGGTSVSDLKTYTYSDVLQGHYALEAERYRSDFTAGVEWSIDDIHNPSSFRSFSFGPFDADRSIDRRMTGFFAENRTRLGENWVLEAGGRWDRIDWDIYDLLSPNLQKRKKADSFSPEAGVEYRIFEPLWAYASYAETFKVPDANALIFETPNLFTPNPDIDPSIARHWEAGARYAHPVFGSVRADYFHVATKKEILFNPISTLNENFDTVRQGVEIADEISVAPGVGVFFNYTYVDAVFDNGAFDAKFVPLVPKNTWTVGAALGPWNGWSFTARATGVEDRFALNDFHNVFPVDDYWTLGLRASYRRGPWEFYLRSENALGERYSSFFTSNGSTTLNVNPAPTAYFEGGFRLEL